MPPDGAFRAVDGVRFAEITDGLTNTLLVGEKHLPLSAIGTDELGTGMQIPLDCGLYDGHNPGCYTRAAGPLFPLSNSNTDLTWNFGSSHPGVCLFVFCDGTVRPLSVWIDPYVLGLLAQRNDDQAIPDY
jgi:hypothetical protein